MDEAALRRYLDKASERWSSTASAYVQAAYRDEANPEATCGEYQVGECDRCAEPVYAGDGGTCYACGAPLFTVMEVG